MVMLLHDIYVTFIKIRDKMQSRSIAYKFIDSLSCIFSKKFKWEVQSRKLKVRSRNFEVGTVFFPLPNIYQF